MHELDSCLLKCHVVEALELGVGGKRKRGKYGESERSLANKFERTREMGEDETTASERARLESGQIRIRFKHNRFEIGLFTTGPLTTNGEG
jgi:hypothetical protein